MSAGAERGGLPAFPVEASWNEAGFVDGVRTGYATGWATGLTKRELFAAMAMQGYCSHPVPYGVSRDDIANWSTELADALLAALSQEGAA